jgi:hypothetical protein
MAHNSHAIGPPAARIRTAPRAGRPALAALVALALVIAALVGASSASAATTTTVATGLTSPNGGVMLTGANGSKHLWIPDHLNGVCRVDATGLNQSTCALVLGPNAIKPGQLSFDPVNNYLYIPDLSAKSQGVYRVAYDPNGDNGNGSLSLFDRTQIAPGCGLGGNLPWSTALGPDGNLYVSFKKSPAIVRITNPAGVSIPCSNVKVMGNASDGRSAFSLAWVGTRLFEADNKGLGVISNATQCAVTVGTCNATPFLTGQIAAPLTVASDQQNSTLYVGDASQVWAVQVGATQSFAVYQTGFSFVSGITVDPSPLGAGNPPVLYVGDDPSNGTLPNTGRIFKVAP